MAGTLGQHPGTFTHNADVGAVLREALGHSSVMVTVHALDAIFDMYSDDELHNDVFRSLGMLAALEQCYLVFAKRVKGATLDRESMALAQDAGQNLEAFVAYKKSMS